MVENRNDIQSVNQYAEGNIGIEVFKQAVIPENHCIQSFFLVLFLNPKIKLFQIERIHEIKKNI